MDISVLATSWITESEKKKKKKKGRMDDKVMLRFGYVNEDIFVRLRRKRAV